MTDQEEPGFVPVMAEAPPAADVMPIGVGVPLEEDGNPEPPWRVHQVAERHTEASWIRPPCARPGTAPVPSIAAAPSARPARRSTSKRMAPYLRPGCPVRHQVQTPKWKPHHAADVLFGSEQEVFPSSGDISLDNITQPMILAVIRTIERRSVDVARRVRQRISAIFLFAIASGLAAQDPAAVVKGALAPHIKGRRPAVIEIDNARGMLASAEGIPTHPAIRLGLRLLAITATRPGELRGARSDEFEDLGGPTPIWRTPPERMKGKQEHIVPSPAKRSRSSRPSTTLPTSMAPATVAMPAGSSTPNWPVACNSAPPWPTPT